MSQVSAQLPFHSAVIIANVVPVTGGEPREVERYDRADRYTLREGILAAARACDERGQPQVLTEDVADLANRGELQSVPGIGKGTAERIVGYLQTGQIRLHQELLASI